jgi:hypothetical protein
MIYPIEVQTVEISAVNFHQITIYLSVEEYKDIKLDNTALIQAIMAALEVSDGS